MEQRYSMKEVMKQKFGETEKNIKTNQATKRASKKASKSKGGKSTVKVVDGVKYMILK